MQGASAGPRQTISDQDAAVTLRTGGGVGCHGDVTVVHLSVKLGSSDVSAELLRFISLNTRLPWLRGR